GDDDQVRAAEHLRVLERLVGALGDGGEHHARALAQIEQGGADEVADILDHHRRPGGRVEALQCAGDHGRVQVAARPGVDLDDLAPGDADPRRVQVGFLIALDDGQSQLPGEVPAGP